MQASTTTGNHAGQWRFLFDADCGFCQRCVSLTRRLRPSVAYIPNSQVDLAAEGLTHQDVQSASWLIGPQGQRYRGADGVGHLLSGADHLPAQVIGKLILTPGVLQLARLAYPFIAKNRGRLPGSNGTCGMNSPAKQQEQPASQHLPAALRTPHGPLVGKQRGGPRPLGHHS